MVDRPSLIKTLDPIIRPTSSQADTIRKALDKVLAEIVLALPLSAVDHLTDDQRRDLELVVRALPGTSAEKLAKAWEPGRKLDTELKRSLSNDLSELIHRRRPLYQPIKIPLAQARDDNSVRSSIANAPVRDLATLLKAWDKHFQPPPSDRARLLQRLRALLDGAKPSPKLDKLKAK